LGSDILILSIHQFLEPTLGPNLVFFLGMAS
jgi:hypothetical protein